jgi:hypothetical protein
MYVIAGAILVGCFFIAWYVSQAISGLYPKLDLIIQKLDDIRWQITAKKSERKTDGA